MADRQRRQLLSVSENHDFQYMNDEKVEELMVKWEESLRNGEQECEDLHRDIKTIEEDLEKQKAKRAKLLPSLAQSQPVAPLAAQASNLEKQLELAGKQLERLYNPEATPARFLTKLEDKAAHLKENVKSQQHMNQQELSKLKLEIAGLQQKQHKLDTVKTRLKDQIKKAQKDLESIERERQMMHVDERLSFEPGDGQISRHEADLMLDDFVKKHIMTKLSSKS